MKCNINARGKAVRLALGMVAALTSVSVAILLISGVIVHSGWWIVVVALGTAGLFGIFEGWTGWCAVRAMGIKTPV